MPEWWKVDVGPLTQMGTLPSLKARATSRLVLALGSAAALLFVSAGSLEFWQGWLFLALMAGFWTFFLIDRLRHDPQVLERRLQRRETLPEQRLFQKLFLLIVILGFILSGLDFRFGWSEPSGAIPAAIIIPGQAIVVAGYWIVFWVMKTNSFAASTIRVESSQPVISYGPYAVVRHPMYSGMALAAIGTPLALGSYVAFPVFVLMIPLLIYRLVHEERLLRRYLPGYAAYCQRTRFRLVPRLW